MTENTDLGTGSPATAAEGSPSQPVQPAAQKPIEGEVAQLLTALSEKVDGFGRELRGLQGRQQKTDNKFTDFQQQLAKFNSIKSQGNLSDEQAMEVMQKGDQEAQRWQSLESKLNDLAARIGGNGNAANGQQVNAAEVFGKILGQENVKNPLLAPYLAKQYATVADAENAAKTLFYDLSHLPNPTAAQQSSLTSGNPSAANLDSLAAEYDRLAVNPSANFERMTQIQQEIDRAVQT